MDGIDLFFFVFSLYVSIFPLFLSIKKFRGDCCFYLINEMVFKKIYYYIRYYHIRQKKKSYKKIIKESKSFPG